MNSKLYLTTTTALINQCWRTFPESRITPG